MDKKFQFSKIVLAVAVIVWVIGTILGWYYVFTRDAGLIEILAYIGSPVAVAYGFYAWKSKAENVIKIAQSVDSNRKISEKTKQQLVKGIAKTLNDIESEDFDSGA